MEANLKYKQRAIVFSDLTTSTLDHLDGLTIKHGTRRAVPSLSLNCVLRKPRILPGEQGLAKAVVSTLVITRVIFVRCTELRSLCGATSDAYSYPVMRVYSVLYAFQMRMKGTTGSSWNPSATTSRTRPISVRRAAVVGCACCVQYGAGWNCVYDHC
jgi:hypothetical protein